MGGYKSGSFSTQAGKNSKENPAGAVQTPQRSQSDSAATTTGRNRGDSDAVPKEPTDESAIDDYYGTDDKYDEEEQEEDSHAKPTISKRHSSSSRTNVYTECGRHSDDWLFHGIGIGGVVKSVFGKNDKNDKK